VLEKLKKNWVLILFYLIMAGALAAYSIHSGRYFVLMVWILAPGINYLYKKFSKKG